MNNIFATTLCRFFVPLAVSVVFGTPRITNIVGGGCVAGEVVAMYFASRDLRGQDPYFSVRLPNALYLHKDKGRNGVTVYDKQACSSEIVHSKPRMQKEKSK